MRAVSTIWGQAPRVSFLGAGDPGVGAARRASRSRQGRRDVPAVVFKSKR